MLLKAKIGFTRPVSIVQHLWYATTAANDLLEGIGGHHCGLKEQMGVM